MAEHDLKITVSADTTDAKKKIEDVGNAKVKPVKVAVEADETGVQSLKSKVQRTLDLGHSTLDISKANVAPVKVPVEADTKDAEKSIGSMFSNALRQASQFRSAVSRVFAVFGFAGFVVNGITLLVDVFRKLHDVIPRAAIAAKAAREEFEKISFEDSLKRAEAANERLNKSLERTVEIEKERNEILAGRKSTGRSIEDANLNREEAQAIAKVDVDAEDYAKQVEAIKREFENRRADVAARRSGEDTREGAADLYRQAETKDREENKYAAQYREAMAKADALQEKSLNAEMAARGNGEWRGGSAEAVKKAEEADERWRKALEFAEKIREQMQKAADEAASLRRKAGEMAGGNLAENINADATRIKNDNESRADAAAEAKSKREKEQEAARKEDDAAKKHADTLARAAKEDAWRRENLGADDETMQNNLRIRENIAKDKFDKAEAEIKAELKKPKEERDQDRIDALRRESEQAQSDMFGFRSQREAIEKSSREKQISDLESSSARAQSVDAVSQNRLTAMGLGSGVSAKGGVQTDIRRIIDLIRQNVEATKNIKTVEIDTTATFTE